MTNYRQKHRGEILERCPRGNGRTKTSFRSAAKARQAIVNARPVAGVPLYPYQCPKCGHWHITGQEQS